MTMIDVEIEGPNRLVTVLRRIGEPAKAATRGGAVVVRHIPPAARAAEGGARYAAGAFVGLSDSRVGVVAASSVGLAAGLYLSGKRPLTVVAGLAPALLAAASMASRRVLRPLGRAPSGDLVVALPSVEA
jgi:hypothetical protein